MKVTEYELDELRTCQGCSREYPRQEMSWAHDRYGIPWKLCCQRCLAKIEVEIAAYRFDPAYAGEALESEDY